MSKIKFANNSMSTREIRRMKQREQRRQDNQQALQEWWSLSPEERQRRIQDHETVQRIQRNGITIEDLNRAAQEAYQEGAKTAAENTMRNIYAAIALVLHEKYNFDKDVCMDALNAVDEKVMYALDSTEMIDQVLNDLGIKMTFDGDPLDERIVDKEA